MTFLCKLCLDSKCEHWTVHHTTKENVVKYTEEVFGVKTIFGRRSHTVEKERIEFTDDMYFVCCCGRKTVPTKDELADYVKGLAIKIMCSCYANVGVYSRSGFAEANGLTENRIFGCKLTEQCKVCDKTGKVVDKKSFTVCKNCEGTGGIECVQCKGMWYKPCTNSWGNVKSCAKCTTGFSDICKVCNGGKRVVQTVMTKDCTECISRKRWIEIETKIMKNVLKAFEDRKLLEQQKEKIEQNTDEQIQSPSNANKAK
jgi:hypothetical protein